MPGPLYTINGLAPSKGDNVILRWDAWFKARSYIDPFSPGPI